MITKELLFKKTSLPAVEKSLDASMLRSKAIANNIANINVPGYKRVEVAFEDDLKKALDKTKLKGVKTDQAHFDLGRPSIPKVHPKSYRPIDPSLPSGENDVDIDMENAKLAETQLLFNFGTRFAQERFSAIQQAIQGKNR